MCFDLVCEWLLGSSEGNVDGKSSRFPFVKHCLSFMLNCCYCCCFWEANKLCCFFWSYYGYCSCSWCVSLPSSSSSWSFSDSHSVISFSAYTCSLECLIGYDLLIWRNRRTTRSSASALERNSSSADGAICCTCTQEIVDGVSAIGVVLSCCKVVFISIGCVRL